MKKQMDPPPKPTPVMMLYWSRVSTVLMGENQYSWQPAMQYSTASTDPPHLPACSARKYDLIPCICTMDQSAVTHLQEHSAHAAEDVDIGLRHRMGHGLTSSPEVDHEGPPLHGLGSAPAGGHKDGCTHTPARLSLQMQGLLLTHRSLPIQSMNLESVAIESVLLPPNNTRRPPGPACYAHGSLWITELLKDG